MKICGIVAEYNPFHNGHKYQIEQARKKSGCDLVIAVMSGNFTQRGEPAIVDKYSRAKTAVENGVDVVIELPYFYATQSASHFAKGAVDILKKANVDYISFGSECGNLENLQDIADTPINPDHLKESLNQGSSFPHAYSLLTSTMQPNDILAVSYLKEIKDSDITPILIPRTMDNYKSDAMSSMASAYAIRSALVNGSSIKDATPMEQKLLASKAINTPDLYYPYLRNLLLLTKRSDLEDTFLFNEGIERHLEQCAMDCSTYDEFLNKAITHRYTAGRIRRTCLQAMVQLRNQEVKNLPELHTLHVLAFNEKGRAYLKEMKDQQENRLVTRFAKVSRPWRELEYRSTLLYTSVLPKEERKRILTDEIGGAIYVK